MPRIRKTVQSLVVGATDNTNMEIPNLPAISPTAVDLRRMIDCAITEQDWISIFSKFRGMAMDGNLKAAEFLAKYRFGLPPTMGTVNDKVSAGIQIVEIIKTTMSRETQDAEIIEGTVEEIE